MHINFNFMNNLVNKNHDSFSDFKNIKWLNPYDAEGWESKRVQFLEGFSPAVKWSFKDTKPWINSISKGCELCGQGEWSCLFIAGKCNANCFYCPAPQSVEDIPTAQQLKFNNADEYADFINYFNFKGCSFSGGEPFLVYEKLILFLETLRKKCSPDLYIWMYTNGILGTSGQYKKLFDLGLNEVRFDIGATNYNIETIRRAKGIIQNITVEIPIDPHKTEFLKELLPQLENVGVTNLNLHQMRLTKHNATKLETKDYTFVHGEHPTVLESELAALELIHFVDSEKLHIGINYCGFQYKQRFQKAGYRLKILGKIDKPGEITENGYLLNLYVSDNDLIINKSLNSNYLDDLIRSGLIRKSTISEFINSFSKFDCAIVEFQGLILSELKDNNPNPEFIHIQKRKYYLEKGMPVAPILIEKEKTAMLAGLLQGKHLEKIQQDDDLFNIWKLLAIESGFRPYF